MKSSRRSNFSMILIMAGLGALYYYQRKGGQVSDLLKQGARYLKQGRQKINEIAPSAVETQAHA